MEEGERMRKPRSRERGAGRHNKGRTAKTISFSCSPEEYERIKRIAQESGESMSRFIIAKLLS